MMTAMYLRHTTVTRTASRIPTGGWFAPSASAAKCVKRRLPSSGNSTPRTGAHRRWPKPSSASNVSPVSSTPPCPEPVTVDLRRFRLERGRRFGDVWLGLRLWQAIGLDNSRTPGCPQDAKKFPGPRWPPSWSWPGFCEPSSELHIAEDWFRRTALGDLLGIADAKVNDDRLYRALDRLLPHKDVAGISPARTAGDAVRPGI